MAAHGVRSGHHEPPDDVVEAGADAATVDPPDEPELEPPEDPPPT